MFLLSLSASLLSLSYCHALSSTPSADHPYHNPVLPGFHPDPSCVLVRDWDSTFFCATSSFNAVPGIPIFASKDLQNFRQIGNVITQATQLPGLASTNGSTSGVWAPTIRFRDGTFWIFTTLVYDHLPQDDASRWDNVIFHSRDPYEKDSWSDAIHFQFEGYDVSPFWDADGTSYVVGSHAWRVEEMIMGFQLDFSSGNIIGNISNLWPGTGGIAPEAPHLFLKSDGYYYLMIAEGGTGLAHMVNMARSSHIFGPYDGSPNNPLLTAANTHNYCTTVGHADLFQDVDGHWWAVALSTRSGPEYLYYPMGRETILTPVTWEEGHFPTFASVQGIEQGPLPPTNFDINSNGYWVGETKERLEFSATSSLPDHLVHQRYPDLSTYLIGNSKDHPNALGLIPSVLNLTGLDGRTATTPQTFVGRRQEHVLFTFEVTMEFDAAEDQAESGITVFLNQNQHFDLGVVALSPEAAIAAGYSGSIMNETTRFIRLRTITENSSNFGASDPFSHPAILPYPSDGAGPLKLQVEAIDRETYIFKYHSGHNWSIVGWGNSSELSGGFVGTIVGIFATGNGQAVTTPAFFWDWAYTGKHDTLLRS